MLACRCLSGCLIWWRGRCRAVVSVVLERESLCLLKQMSADLGLPVDVVAAILLESSLLMRE